MTCNGASSTTTQQHAHPGCRPQCCSGYPTSACTLVRLFRKEATAQTIASLHISEPRAIATNTHTDAAALRSACTAQPDGLGFLHLDLNPRLRIAELLCFDDR